MSIGEQSVKFIGRSKAVKVAQPPDWVASNRHLSSKASPVPQLIVHCEVEHMSELGGAKREERRDTKTNSSERRIAISSRDSIVTPSKASFDTVDLSDAK